MLTSRLLLHRSDNPADLYNRYIQIEDKMYNAFWRHALFVRGQSFSVKTFDRSRNGCQVIREGDGNDFRGPSVQALPLPSLVSFSRTRFFLCPLLPKACYAGYLRTETRIIHRYPLSIYCEIIAGHAQELSPNPSGPSCSKAVNVVGIKVYFGFLILLIKSILSDNFLYSF